MLGNLIQLPHQLAQFTLTGIISSPTASLKMISGFDIGTNQTIVTSLGIPTTTSGNVVASPFGTVASLAQANASDVGLSTIVDRVATYFNVSATSQSNLDIISDDPLSNLKNSDANVVSAARDVFEANQYTMALAHVAEATGNYLAEVVDSAIQTALSNAGHTGISALAGGSSTSYQKIGADGLLETASNRIQPEESITSSNAFQLGSNQVTWNDYDSTLSLDVTNRAITTTSSNVLSLGSSRGQLTLGNLTNAANATGTYKTPTLSFDLSKVPTGSGSGTISLDLINGTDATRDAGERHIHLDLSVNWSGDGSSASITMPVQTVSGYYLTTSGSRIDFTIANLDSDTISLSKSGADYPTVLDVKFGTLVDQLESVGLTSLLTIGDFYLTVGTDLPVVDANGASITSITTGVQIVASSSLTAYAQDATAYEGDTTPTAVVYLNRVHTEDVTLNYSLSTGSGDTATAGSDYTATNWICNDFSGLHICNNKFTSPDG